METAAPAITPDAIDPSFVPVLVPDVEVVSVGDEQIVIGGDAQLLVLNPTAALVFGFLDGEAKVGELVDDFTDVLGLDRSIVEADVLEFVRELASSSLLEGVGPPEPVLPEGLSLTPVAMPQVGDELDDFTLPDLDGDDHTLSDLRGQQVLLVNWSPTCGFCVMIADELAALDPVLAARDARLVLIASGDVDANREVHERHGLEALTVLRNASGVDPFRGTGTPAAYVLDADGRVAEDLVVGAVQVPMAARDLAGVDPATPYGTEPTDDVLAAGEVRGRYLPAPGAMCGPGGGASVGTTDWAGTAVYSLGGYHVGLRYDDDETAAILDRLFPDVRVNDRRAPDNYSIALGGTTTKGAGVARSLALLVRGGTQLVRSRSGGRVLAALLQYLASDLGEIDPALTRVGATAVLRGDQAVLLPAGLVNVLKQLQPRLARADLALVDAPQVLLDLDARELVVPEPAIAHDPTVVDELDAPATLGSEPPRVRPGRYPLRAWCVVRGPEHVGRLRPANAITAAVPQLVEPGDLADAVAQLAHCLEDVAPVGLFYENLDELVEQAVATYTL